MTYPINVNIPDEDNDPLDDVEPMRTNFNNINSYVSVNHVAPGAVNAGYHTRVDWVAPISPSAPSGTQGIDYTAAGIAQPSVPQRFFQNAQNTFPISAVKAYGRIDGAGPTYEQSYNTSGAPAYGGLTTLNITLQPNLVSDNAVVIPFVTKAGAGTLPSIVSYSITSNVLSIVFTSAPVSQKISFLVLEI